MLSFILQSSSPKISLFFLWIRTQSALNVIRNQSPVDETLFHLHLITVMLLFFLHFNKLEFLPQACACFWVTPVVSEANVVCWPSTLGLRFPWRAASVCSHLRRARWHLSNITLPQISQGLRKSFLGCVISEPLAASKGTAKIMNIIGWDRTGHVELLKQSTNVLIYSICSLWEVNMNGLLIVTFAD